MFDGTGNCGRGRGIGIAVITLIGLAAGVSWAVPVTTVYEFVPESSEFQMHGMRGGSYVYSVDGWFELLIDHESEEAHISSVETELSGLGWGDGLGIEDVFYIDLMDMESTFVGDDVVTFFGDAGASGIPVSDITLNLVFAGSSVYLTAAFGELLDDGYQYRLDAVAVPEPGCMLMLGLGMLGLGRGRLRHGP